MQVRTCHLNFRQTGLKMQVQYHRSTKPFLVFRRILEMYVTNTHKTFCVGGSVSKNIPAKLDTYSYVKNDGTNSAPPHSSCST